MMAERACRRFAVRVGVLNKWAAFFTGLSAIFSALANM